MSQSPEWDGEPWRALRNVKLNEWLLGNKQAVAVVLAISTIAETWDDLADGDNPPDTNRVNEAFTLALVRLQENDFYKANEALFWSQIVTAINAWMDANEMQSSPNEHERMLAFFLRNIGLEIAMLAAHRVGGWEHLRSVSIEIRRFFTHETFQNWEHKHGNA